MLIAEVVKMICKDHFEGASHLEQAVFERSRIEHGQKSQLFRLNP